MSLPGYPVVYKGKSCVCSVELVLEVVGGKWKPIILWRLKTNGTMRFGQLKQELPGLTQRMLTRQLRELESDGIICRTVYAQVPPKVEYSLTELGRSFVPALEALCAWGKEYRRIMIGDDGQTPQSVEG